MITTTFTDVITEESQLREVFGWPTERSKNKEINHLDKHCQAIIAKCPFLLLGTSAPDGRCDVSPKGDFPGFVRVLDDKTLVIPDLPGNNRLDTLTNHRIRRDGTRRDTVIFGFINDDWPEVKANLERLMNR